MGLASGLGAGVRLPSIIFIFYFGLFSLIKSFYRYKWPQEGLQILKDTTIATAKVLGVILSYALVASFFGWPWFWQEDIWQRLKEGVDVVSDFPWSGNPTAKFYEEYFESIFPRSYIFISMGTKMTEFFLVVFGVMVLWSGAFLLKNKGKISEKALIAYVVPAFCAFFVLPPA